MNLSTRFPAASCDGRGAGDDITTCRGRSRTSSYHQENDFGHYMGGDRVEENNGDDNLTNSIDPVVNESGAVVPSFPLTSHRRRPSLPYPGIRTELDPDSGLGCSSNENDVDTGERLSGGGDGRSFLGFGCMDDPFELNEDVVRSENCGSRGRSRSTSCYVFDLGSTAESSISSDIGVVGGIKRRESEGARNTVGCDLGYGEDGGDFEEVVCGRTRGDYEPEGAETVQDEGGDDCFGVDMQGRAQEVPDYDPNWATMPCEDPLVPAVRPARARSHSIYEDDDETMAIIDNRTLPRSSSCSVDRGEFFRISNRHGSLAYSSSDELSTFELERWNRNRESPIFSKASRTTGSRVAPAKPGSEAGEEGGRDPGLMAPSSTSLLSGDRCLTINEVQALKEGLGDQHPSRKSSSDREFSSDDDPEVDQYYDVDGDVEIPHLDYDAAVTQHSQAHESPHALLPMQHGPFTPTAEDLSLRDFGVVDGVVSVGVIPGPDPISPTTSAAVVHRRFTTQHTPPEDDPFLSVPNRIFSPPLSPRAGVDIVAPGGASMRRNSAPSPGALAAAIAFPSHFPAPQHSPPRLPSPRSTPSVPFENDEEHEDVEEDDAGNLAHDERPHTEAHVNVVQCSGSAELTLWSTEESGSAGETLDVTDARNSSNATRSIRDSMNVDGVEVGVGDIESTSGDRVDAILGSPPATFDSLHLSGPRSPPTQLQQQHMVPVSLPPSPPAPPPTQPAPRPPLEPVAASPPRPPTQDAPLPPPPASPAEQAPTIGTPPLRGEQSLSLDGEDGKVMASVYATSPSNVFQSSHLPPTPGNARSTFCASGGSSGNGGSTRTGGVFSGGSYGSGGSGSGFVGTTGVSGGGVSRLMGPGGPFGTNRPGYGNFGGYAGGVGGYGPRTMYHSGPSSGNGQSTLYGSAPGTLGDGSSAWTDPGFRGRLSVQGFFSAGGGSRHILRRPPPMQPPKKIKLLMLGDSGVGKSSLVERFTEDHFNPSTVGTFGVDFKLKEAMINDEDVVVQVWDTAGQQRFHKITQAYYRGSHGIVLVYDVANPETLDNIGYWMKSIRENSRENADSKQVQICLVGNKVDLREETGRNGAGNMVSTKSGKSIADKFGAYFYECSAKTGVRVEEAFMTVAAKAFEACVSKPPTPSSRSRKHRFTRRKHQRQLSHGSDRDRPPRSEASWSTASSSSAMDSGESTASALSQGSAMTSAPMSSHSLLRANSFATSNSVASTPTSTTMAGTASPPMLLNPPSDGALQDLIPPLAALSPVAAASALSKLELGRAHSDQGPTGEHVRRGGRRGVVAGVGGVVGMLKGKQSSGSGVGIASGGSDGGDGVVGIGGQSSAKKSIAEEDEGDDSPTGTGTLSPLPGHQRSLGNASSLADMDGNLSPPLSPVTAGTGSARHRSNSGSLLERVFGGVSGGESSSGSAASDAGSSVSGEDGSSSNVTISGGRGGMTSKDISRVRSQHGSQVDSLSTSPRDSGGGNDITGPSAGGIGGRNRHDGGGEQAPKPKGKKPPKIPKARRTDSGDNGSGAGGRRVCKVS